MLKTCDSPLHNVVSTDLDLKINQGKIRGMFLLFIISQIVNLKMIRDVLVFIKCYQCGGETLGPVVKHSVRDSSSKPFQVLPIFNRDCSGLSLAVTNWRLLLAHKPPVSPLNCYSARFFMLNKFAQQLPPLSYY